MYTSVILFHETFLTQQQEIQNTLTPETLLLPFSPVEATYSTMKQQLLDLKLEHPELQNIALFQHSEFDTFSFLGNELYPLLDVSTNDPSLEKWTTFKDFVLFLQNDLNIANFDLLMCKIFSDPNWKFVISQFESQLTTLNIRSSDDNTGHVIFDGDWVLESEGVDVDMINLYFTEEILKVEIDLANEGYYRVCIGSDMQSLYFYYRGPARQFTSDNDTKGELLRDIPFGNYTLVRHPLFNNQINPEFNVLAVDEMILQVIFTQKFTLIRTSKNRILTSGWNIQAAWGVWTYPTTEEQNYRTNNFHDIAFKGENPLLTKKVKFVDYNYQHSSLILFEDGTMYIMGNDTPWEDTSAYQGVRSDVFAREVIFDHTLLDVDETIVHAVICIENTICVLTNKNRIFTKGCGPCNCRDEDIESYDAFLRENSYIWNWGHRDANNLLPREKWKDWGEAMYTNGHELELDENIIQMYTINNSLFVATDKNNLFVASGNFRSVMFTEATIFPTKLTKIKINRLVDGQEVNFQNAVEKFTLGNTFITVNTNDGQTLLLRTDWDAYSSWASFPNINEKRPLLFAVNGSVTLSLYDDVGFSSNIYGTHYQLFVSDVNIYKTYITPRNYFRTTDASLSQAGFPSIRAYYSGVERPTEYVIPTEDLEYMYKPGSIVWVNNNFSDFTISEIDAWNNQPWKDPNKVEVSQLLTDISLVGVDAGGLDTLINTDLTNIDDKNGITISYINKDTDRKSFKKIMHQMFIRNTKKSIRMKKENIPMPDKTREQLESRSITSLVVTSPNTILQPSDLNSNDAFYAPLYDNGQFTEFALNDNGDKIKITKTGEDTYQIHDASGNVQNKVTDDIVRMDGLVFILGGVTAYQQSIPCFLKGTEILTIQGYKKVEDLRPGKDKLLDHNHHVLECLEVQKYTQSWNGKDFPCVIPKGAELSKEFVCTKDLYLTKNHGIYLPHLKYFYPSMRMKVKQDTTKVDKYEYFHVFTNNFFCDTIIANGIPCETHSKYVLEHIRSVDACGRLLKTILDTCKAENDGSRKRLSKKEYNRLVHSHNKKKKTNKSPAKS